MFEPALNDLLGAAVDLRDAHVLAREIRRADNRRRWRRGVQLRTTSVAATVRTVERVLGDRYVWRLREGGAWKIFGRNNCGDVVPVAVVGSGSRHTLEELNAPIRVDVLDAMVLDVERLTQEVRMR